ncbi:MAG: hypothetical protein IKD93_04880 [Firmicutes bacterium]|nr:hypothetical protein [Bacillota bacterium]
MDNKQELAAEKTSKRKPKKLLFVRLPNGRIATFTPDMYKAYLERQKLESTKDKPIWTEEANND